MTAGTAKSDLEQAWQSPSGLRGLITAVNHKQVGMRYIITAFIFFLIGGINALLIRTQLIRPENDFLSAGTYNEIFTMHGTTMMFLFAVPIVEGLASYLVPLMVGARDMVFPRLNAFGYWCFALGGIFLYSSFLFGEVPDGGWFAYVPLTNAEFSPGMGMDFWLLGISFVEISGLVAAVEIIVTILKSRAPGMTLNRIPIFVWAALAMSVAIVFGFPPLVVASAMLELDRAVGTAFFDADVGGSPLLWQHLFWTFGHPEVYIQFLPAVGVISMVIPTFSRRPIVAYVFVVLAVLLTGMLSFHLWVHHMYAIDLPAIALAFFMAASVSIAIPSGVQIFAWIATIWGGRPIWSTAMLFALGFILIFVIGGITGVMVALVPLDWQVHDSYFVVAHFHYVLIGGVVFPIFAAFYYWFPKITGKLLSEKLGWLHFGLFFGGFNLAFFLMHITGLLGMPRRVYTYPADAGWSGLNFWETIGAYIIGLGVIAFVVNVVYSWVAGEPAGNDPWQGNSLEWATTSPPPGYNFAVNPLVRGRNPLWDESEEQAEEPLLAAPVHGLRLNLTTSVLDAEPQHLTWLPKPSYVPFLTAVAVGSVFVGILVKTAWLIVPALLAALALLVAWLWPGDEERGIVHRDELVRGLEIDATGRDAPSWWGMVMAIAILGTAFVVTVASYYYLWSAVDSWPPEGISRPDLLIPGIAAAALVATAGLVHLARRAISRGDAHASLVLLGIGLLAGLGALAAAGLHALYLDFSGNETVYGSIYYLLGGLLGAFAIVGVIMIGFAIARHASLSLTAGRHQTIVEVALYWYFVAAAAVLAYIVLILSPYLG